MESSLTFQEIYKTYKPKFYNYVRYRITGKSNCVQFDCEEITNDIFLKVYKYLPEYDNSKSAMETWLYNIANSVIIDWYRTKMKKQQQSINTIESKLDNSISFNVIDNNIKNDFDSYDNQIIKTKIDNSISNLKGISQDIAKLYFINELNLNEIVIKLHLPMGTVKNKIFRIRKILQKELVVLY
jgi:RNA polymerase sigma-70 factor, ECF subfamily